MNIGRIIFGGRETPAERQERIQHWWAAQPSITTRAVSNRAINYKAERDALRDVLTDVAVYLDDHSDVIDGPEGQPMPNKAMVLLREVERVLAQVKN